MMKVLEQSQGAVTVVKPSGPLIATDADEFRRLFLDAQQCGTAGKIVAYQVACESQSGLERMDLLRQLVAV